jgi:cytochrome d ubiquinol oxidase subunit II
MLETTWFILWAVLWAAYFMLDGFDLGLGSLMPFIAGDDSERRIIYNAMGPFWDGNEVWLITAGGATFAAFPITYAVMFSSLYTPLLLILFALIVRGVAFHFRGKIDSPTWRHLWDIGLALGSFIPALLFGVAFANIFQGLPIDERGVFHGNILTLLNPYGLTGGLLFVLLFMVHGALWLAIKSTGGLQDRAAYLATQLWMVLVVVAVVFLGSSWFVTGLYFNYLATPVLFVIPAVMVAALFMIRVFAGRNAWWKAWFASSLTIVGTTLFGVAGLYPDLLPSSIDRAFSLTAFNSASSELTLKIMLGLALTVVPVVILYQIWVYKVFSHKVTEEDLAYEEAY